MKGQNVEKGNLSVESFIKLCSNRKAKTKLKWLMEVKRYFLSMYRCYLVMLYDKNYISDPTRYDESQILKNMVEMGILDIFDHTGKVELSSDPDHVLFACYKNKHDSEKCEFLRILYMALKYRDFANKVDILYEENNFSNLDSAVIKMNMTIKGALVVQKSGIEFDEAFAMCISSFEQDVKFYSINDKLWEFAMEELDIPESDWGIDGIFDSSLTHVEEVRCMRGILNGTYHISGGKYEKRLNDWLSSHRWNNTVVYKSDMRGLYDRLYSQRVFEITGILNNVLNELNSQGSNILSIDKDRVYYTVDRDVYKMPFGVFSVICDCNDSEDILPDVNILNGFTGEVYTVERLTEDDISYVGCPINLESDSGKSIVLYDLEQTNITGNSWFAANDVDISFDGTDLKNPYEVDSLQYQLYQGYLDSMSDSKALICDIRVSGVSYNDFKSAKKEVIKKLGR